MQSRQYVSLFKKNFVTYACHKSMVFYSHTGHHPLPHGPSVCIATCKGKHSRAVKLGYLPINTRIGRVQGSGLASKRRDY